MDLKPGNRLRSAVCTAEVVVVRAADTPVDLRFGGHPAAAAGTEPAGGVTADPALTGELRLGARYFDAETGIEVLVTKTGTSMPTVGDRPLIRRDPKSLPASD